MLFILFLLAAGIVLPLLALLISPILRGNRYAFGWEGIWSYALLRLKPSREPDWKISTGSRVSTVEPKVAAGSLRHSIFYQDTSIAADLVLWFRNPRQHNGYERRVVDHRTTVRLPARRVSPWLIPLSSATIAIATCAFLERRHFSSLDSLRYIALGTIDGLDKKVDSNLLSIRNFVIFRKSSKKWTIRTAIRPKSQVCFLTGLLNFSNYSSTFEAEVDDYWWFSDKLVDQDEQLKQSLIESHAVKEDGRWRTDEIEQVFHHSSTEGRVIKFTAPINSKRNILNEVRISAYNGSENSLLLAADVDLICTGELPPARWEIVKETQNIKFDAGDSVAFYNRGKAHLANNSIERAIDDFTDAVRINPAYTAALESRGGRVFRQ